MHSLKISQKQLIQITEKLALLISNGIAIHRAVEIIKAQSSKKTSNAIMKLFDFMCECPHTESSDKVNGMIELGFPEYYLRLVLIGQRTGKINRLLSMLTDFLKIRLDYFEKILSASLYPVLVLFFTITGAVLLIIFAIPATESLFLQIGSDNIDFFQKSIDSLKIIVIGLISGVIFPTGIHILQKNFSPAKIGILDHAIIHFPVIGDLLRDWGIQNWTGAMNILCQAGIPVDKALMEADKTSSVRLMDNNLKEVSDIVSTGQSLSTAITNVKYFPPEISEWLFLAESTGRTAWVFQQLHAYYKAQANKKLQRISALLEPSLVIISAIILALIIILLVVPILKIYGEAII